MFAGDVILVTGAGGNLGSAVTKLLASSGARLVAVERTENSLARVMGGLAAPGVHLGVPGVDLRDPSSCQALAHQALQRFGRIDGLVHSVGSFAMAELAAADPIRRRTVPPCPRPTPANGWRPGRSPR
jgi:NAD(P)-dependent dehydrogenase (short-subunit alcohol dehydrogenase family)